MVLLNHSGRSPWRCCSSAAPLRPVAAARRPASSPSVLVAVAIAGGHGPAREGGGAARPAVRLLLHLVRRQLLGSRQDRLPAARPLLERRRNRHAKAHPWAKRAGIDGFIVSWKSTPVLDRRLDTLIAVAGPEHFKLAIIYQGLDFDREPLPATQVAADLDYFTRRFARRPGFHVFGKPLVIWSGTWIFTPREIARSPSRGATSCCPRLRAVRRRLRRVADLVDGDAYYWSSVNPDTYPDYPQQARGMGSAVHANGGLWIAPAAPGFDARLLGGTTVVDRRDGDDARARAGRGDRVVPRRDRPDQLERVQRELVRRAEPEVRLALPQRARRHARRAAPAGALLRLERPGGHWSQLRPAAPGRRGAVLRRGCLLVRRSQRRRPPAPDLTRRGYGGPQ